MTLTQTQEQVCPANKTEILTLCEVILSRGVYTEYRLVLPPNVDQSAFSSKTLIETLDICVNASLGVLEF